MHANIKIAIKFSKCYSKERYTHKHNQCDTSFCKYG